MALVRRYLALSTERNTIREGGEKSHEKYLKLKTSHPTMEPCGRPRGILITQDEFEYQVQVVVADATTHMENIQPRSDW